MKHSTQSSGDFGNTILIAITTVLFLLSPFIIIWLLGVMSPSQNVGNGTTPQEAAQRNEYESFKVDQRLEENSAQEACIDQMEQDIERYGEWAINTYDC